MDDPFSEFLQYIKLSDELIEQSGRGLAAETARMAALMAATNQPNHADICDSHQPVGTSPDIS